MPISVEQNLISAVLRTKDMSSALAHGASAELFHGYKDEWTWIEQYVNRYRRVPSRAAFKGAWPEFFIRPVDDVQHYVDEVRKNHARIVMSNAMRQSVDLLSSGEVDAAVSLVHKEITQVAANLGVIKDTDILSDWQSIYEIVKTRKHTHDVRGYSGIPTGFTSLDENTGGIQPGQHWVIGARLGVGKSWTLMRMATSAVMQGFTVQYNSLEMPRADVSMRMHTFLSNEVGQSLFKSLDLMQGRNFDLQEYERFLKSLKKDIKGNLHVNDQKMGPLELAAQIERNHPDIVFIDYLTLMRMAATRDSNRWANIGDLSKEIHDIAKDYNVPIVSAAQLNRQHGLSKNEPAGPEALSESDAIGQDADGVITMRAPSPSTMVMKMAKHRHGRSGFKWYCHFDPSKGIFKEVTHDEMLNIVDNDGDSEDAR